MAKIGEIEDFSQKRASQQAFWSREIDKNMAKIGGIEEFSQKTGCQRAF